MLEIRHRAEEIVAKLRPVEVLSYCFKNKREDGLPMAQSSAMWRDAGALSAMRVILGRET